MSDTAKYFIVEASAMPEIFRKVAQAKRLLETGEAEYGERGGPGCGHQPQRLL